MSSKACLLLALLTAVVLLISSEVAARDLAETSSEKNNGDQVATETTGFDDAKVDGGPGRIGDYVVVLCPYGCCQSSNEAYGCKRCCSHPAQAADAETQTYPRN